MLTIVDPDGLRRFATYLEETSRALAADLTGMDGAVRDLHSVWQDRKYASFSRAYADASVELARLYPIMERYATHLRRRASVVDEYLEGGY